MDLFHLFYTGLTDTFEEHGCNLIQSEPSQIIKSRMEEYFDAALSNARMMLSNKKLWDMYLEIKLEVFLKRPCVYAQLCIKEFIDREDFIGRVFPIKTIPGPYVIWMTVTPK